MILSSGAATYVGLRISSFERQQGWSKLSLMLFMVIEHFKDGSLKPIGERFQLQGRMLPEGVVYLASWVDPAGTRCYQVMEAPHQEALEVWASRWQDLVDFEIVPVLPSSDFWAKTQLE